MNIDGSWKRDRRVAGFGIIVWGLYWQLCGSEVWLLGGCLLPSLGRSYGGQRRFNLGGYWGFQKIHYESNSVQIVKASKDPSTNLSLVGQIVEDIKVLLLTIIEAICTDTH